MDMKLLHFHYESPDDVGNEYYVIFSNEDKEDLLIRINRLEDEYCNETPEDEKSRYDKADYVVEHMREQGVQMVWLHSPDIIRRDYEWW